MASHEAAPVPVPSESGGADIVDLRDKDPVAEALRQNRLVIDQLKTNPDMTAVRLYTPVNGDPMQENKMWLGLLDEQGAGDTIIISPNENTDLRGRIDSITAYESEQPKNDTVLMAYYTYDEQEKGRQRHYIAFKDKKATDDFLNHQRETMKQNSSIADPNH